MKKLLLVTFAVITFIPAFAYFVSCLTPYISPVAFWPMAFLALGLPYLASSVFILALVWIFIKKRVGLCMFLLFFAGFQNLFATFALNFSEKSSYSKPPESLRVLTWNVRGFDNPTIGPDSLTSVRAQMFQYIAKVNPDVLCLQEFVEHEFPGTFSNTADLRKLGYLYNYKTNAPLNFSNAVSAITSAAIFSKTPMIDTNRVLLGDSSYREYLASAVISFQNKKLRIFTTHFKSINLFASHPVNNNRVIFYGDSNFVYTSSKFEKLRAFAQAHSKEALIAKAEMTKSVFPIVIGLDMNSIPTSYQYHFMAAGLQDAFKLNGWGLGTTMADLPKTLRIDFLLADCRLAIINYCKDEIYLSDHFPQFMDVKWKK
ncbi:MAG: endonuclease/exonuclease/phosphatase family protein [Bacteroidota bacterium]|nr:endonuclease/exonuclease/phosphatase family protein [Bacteroidota bacterium]